MLGALFLAGVFRQQRANPCREPPQVGGDNDSIRCTSSRTREAPEVLASEFARNHGHFAFRAPRPDTHPPSVLAKTASLIGMRRRDRGSRMTIGFLPFWELSKPRCSRPESVLLGHGPLRGLASPPLVVYAANQNTGLSTPALRVCFETVFKRTAGVWALAALNTCSAGVL